MSSMSDGDYAANDAAPLLWRNYDGGDDDAAGRQPGRLTGAWRQYRVQDWPRGHGRGRIFRAARRTHSRARTRRAEGCRAIKPYGHKNDGLSCYYIPQDRGQMKNEGLVLVRKLIVGYVNSGALCLTLLARTGTGVSSKALFSQVPKNTWYTY